MTSAAEDFGTALDKASPNKAKGETAAAAAATEAYQPNASNATKQKDTKVLNQSLVESGLIPGLHIAGLEGTEQHTANGHNVITVDISADKSSAGLGDDPTKHHQAIYDETTHELSWTRNATIQGNDNQEETVRVNMMSGQETVNWGDSNNMKVVIRAHTGDQAYTTSTVKDGKITATQSVGADGKFADEKHGDTSVKKDDQGNVKEYGNGNYTLSKHDDGKWYFHQNGGDHKFVEVDGDSIKMDDTGKVTYNESGMFGNNDQTLGNGSTGGINDVKNVVSTVSNDIGQTAADVWHDPTNIGAVFNDVKNTATDVVDGAATLATDAVHAAVDINKNIALGVEGYGQGLVNGAIDTINHFGEEAHDGWGLPSFHINDTTLPNQAEVDKSWGGQAGKFIGGLGSTVVQGLGDTVVDLGKATYNFDKMMVNDATTLVTDAVNDPSKLGSDFGNMAQQGLDFGKGVVEGLAIKPINAVIGGADSALNWATDSHDFDNRFKLGNLVDEEYERTHAAAKMGDVVGNVALQVGLIVATDGLSEAAIGAGGRVLGAAGKVFGKGSRTAEGVEDGAAGAVTEPIRLPQETPSLAGAEPRPAVGPEPRPGEVTSPEPVAPNEAIVQQQQPQQQWQSQDMRGMDPRYQEALDRARAPENDASRVRTDDGTGITDTAAGARSPYVQGHGDALLRTYHIGDDSYALLRDGNNWYRPLKERTNGLSPDADVKVRVSVDSPQSLREAQQLLIPALEKDPELSSLVSVWKTVDPAKGFDENAIVGQGQNAKGFTIYTDSASNALKIAQKVDKLLAENNLGTAQAAADASSIYKINEIPAWSQSNRVGLLRDTFERSVDSTANAPRAALDAEVQANIEKRYASQLAGNESQLPAETLREIENSAGLVSNTLDYDSAGRLSLKLDAKINGKDASMDQYHGGVYATELNTSLERGSLTNRRALYSLYDEFGENPTVLAAEREQLAAQNAPTEQFSIPEAQRPVDQTQPPAAPEPSALNARDFPRVNGAPLPFEQPVSLGRGPASIIKGLTDDQVSREQAWLYADRNGGIYIADNSSLNGTFINGQRLPGLNPDGSVAWRPLLPTDQVTFGSTYKVNVTGPNPSR